MQILIKDIKMTFANLRNRSPFIALLFVVSLLSFKATASTYYFKTEQGEEIRVELSTSSNRHHYILQNNGAYDYKYLMKEFIKSTLERRNYYYSWRETCDDCYGDLSFGAQTNDLVEATSRKRVPTNVPNSKSPINEAIMEGARQAGSNSVDRVFEYLFDSDGEDSSVENSQFFVMISRSGGLIPIGVCAIKETSCNMVEDVTVTRTEDGGFMFDFPAFDAAESPKENGRRHAINEAIYGYIQEFTQRHFRITCKTVYTGRSGNLSAQTICYPSY